MASNCEMCVKPAKFRCTDCDVALCPLHIKEHKDLVPDFPHKIAPMSHVNPSPVIQPPHPNYRLFVPFSRSRLLAKWMADTTELERVQLSQKVKFTDVTVSVVLPDGNMFACAGRGKRDRRAALINITSGEVTLLPNMNIGRGNPGVVHVSGVVYVFGGFINGTTEYNPSAEKFQFGQSQWVNLRNQMANSRFQFTPYAYGQVVYLAGGWNTTSVEAFNIPTETFSTLPLVLPKPFCTTCLVHNNELIIMQERVLIRWSLNSQSGDTRSHSLSEIVKDSTVGVQIRDNKAYFTDEKGDQCKVYQLNLNDWSVMKVAAMGTSSSSSQGDQLNMLFRKLLEGGGLSH